ncbi:MAG TPA: HesA/MoeB/ThiF family protein [Albidovulum sp.]|uniref:HesA/MoeB/ThiF family protein n=1 Tax=Albidovulum sp. TaxID=1872424 RepID=UPI002B65D863|nr:HesA/MoeB/ThiF family protein [Albidovulum sp.]
MTVLLVAAALLALGLLLKVPRALILWGIGLIWLATVMAHALLPPDHPLPRALGGDLRAWGFLGILTALVLTYRAGFMKVKALARPAPAPVSQGPFTTAELDRYARHIVLHEIGGMGQRRMKEAKVLVVGAGGLGSPALLYLAGAGIGTIGVIDNDTVSVSNLQRQVIHTDARIGQPKVFSAEAAMKAINPHVEVRPYNRRLTAGDAAALFADYDLILDGSDNFDTRYLVNVAAVAAKKPLISAAITQWEGQIGLYDPARGAPCYACVFPERPAAGLAPTCAEAGVMGALPGVVGSMMAVEAIKAITGAGETLRGRMMIYDALYGETRVFTVKRDPGCKVCGQAH